MPDPVDWRGTPIVPGALVVYGAPVGRSIAMVEARVSDPMLTPSGRIWLDVVRRSYSHTDGGRVHVGADRLTVVTELPSTTVPTDADRAARLRLLLAAREAYAEGLHEREHHEAPAAGWVSTGPAEWQREYRPCHQCNDAIQEFNETWKPGDTP